jgi:hypothetical protein
MRSKPEVSAASIKYDPLLPIGTRLQVVTGPEAGSGYWWYRVDLIDGLTLYRSVRSGWVAAAARDGTPWIAVHEDVDPGPTPPTPVTGWPTIRRGVASLTGGDLRQADDGASLHVPVTIRGLLPGTMVQLDAVGSYHFEWVCTRPDDSPIGVAAIDNGQTEGTAKARIDVRVDGAGIGFGTVVLVPAPPKPCPKEYPDLCGLGSQWWDGVRITDAQRGLMLAPAKYGWDITF